MRASEDTVRMLKWVVAVEGVLILGLVALLALRGGDAPSPVDEPAAEVTVAPAEAVIVPGRELVAAGAVESERTVSPPAAPEASPAPATDEATRVVHGRVTDTEGNAVRTAVVFTRPDDILTRWTAAAQQDGQYAVAGLPWEPVDVRVAEPGFRPYAGSLDPAVTRLDVVLEPALLIEIAVRTTDGRPFREAGLEELGLPRLPFLAAYPSRDPVIRLPLSNLRDAPRSELGHFRGGERADGRATEPDGTVIGLLQMNAAPPFHVALLLRQTVLASQPVTAPVETLTFVVDPATIRSSSARVRLRVVDRATRAPLTKGRVALSDRQSSTGGVRPDEGGNVVLDGLVPGLLVLEPFFAGYAPALRYVRVPPGADLDLGEVALDRPAAIRGVVRDEDGAPVDARIVCRDREGLESPQPIDVGIMSRTGADGAFLVSSAGRGPHLLFVTPRSTSHTRRTVAVDTTGGDVENLDIVLRRGVEVTFERASATPVLWQLFDETGNVVLGILASAKTAKVHLAPGRYTMRTYQDEAVVHSVPFQVGAAPLLVSLDG